MHDRRTTETGEAVAGVSFEPLDFERDPNFRAYLEKYPKVPEKWESGAKRVFFLFFGVCVFYLKRQGSWGTCTIVERLESSTSVRGAGSGCMRRLQKTMLVCEGDVRTQVLDGCRQRCRVQMKHSERYSSFALEPKHKHRSIIKSSSTLRTQTL